MAARIWKHWTAVAALALATAWPAAAQQEPPGRVARLSQPDGVQWAGPEGAWRAAEPHWPFTQGDRIRVGAGSRAELHAGAHALRLQGPAELSIEALDDDDLRLTLQQGSLNLRVRELGSHERIEVSTQNLALLVDQPGELRIDVDADSTRVAARAGSATLFGENGESTSLAPAQQARYVGRNLQAVLLQGSGPRDALDQWAAERNQAEEQSISAQYLSRETLGYQELDAYGDWSSHAEYGTVWYPRVPAAGWAPYRNGQWRWVAPWGWTWFDDARWGFAPFHYGRWVQIGPRWAWAPGARGQRPIYSPALVEFAGQPAPRPPGFGRHRTPGTDWVPLGPGQRWQPSPGFGPRYPDRVNRDLVPRDPVRRTMRERPPGSELGLPAPGQRHDPWDAQRRAQREQEWQRQELRERQHRQQQSDLQQRHELLRQEQQQRGELARQQQRALQDLQTQQIEQQRRLQDRQRWQMQEPHRQHERFMREQRDRADPSPRQMQPPRDVSTERREQRPEAGRRPGNRD